MTIDHRTERERRQDNGHALITRYAERATERATGEQGTAAVENYGPTDAAADAIVDVLHFAASIGAEPDTLLLRARRHASEENAGELSCTFSATAYGHTLIGRGGAFGWEPDERSAGILDGMDPSKRRRAMLCMKRAHSQAFAAACSATNERESR